MAMELKDEADEICCLAHGVFRCERNKNSANEYFFVWNV